MTTFKERVFEDSTEVIDGREFTHCEFKNCTIVYKGGTLPIINACHFHDCRWQFEDAADRTINFMRFLYHCIGDRGKMVESMFEQLRQAVPAGGAK